MVRIRPSSTLIALLLALVAAACSDKDSVGPTPITVKEVAGTYVASGEVGALTFTAKDAEAEDWLEAGAEIEVELDEDGTTTGKLFLPATDEEGDDLEADLAGTWTLKGDTVQLKHEDETFLLDMKFVVKGEELVGSADHSDGVIKATLVKSKP
jgi:hypothetical protein